MTNAHGPGVMPENVKHTFRLVRLCALRLEYRLAPHPLGYTVTVAIETDGRRTEDAVTLPTLPLAADFLALAARHLVTPVSLPAVYDDFLAASLSLLP